MCVVFVAFNSTHTAHGERSLGGVDGEVVSVLLCEGVADVLVRRPGQVGVKGFHLRGRQQAIYSHDGHDFFYEFVLK